MGQLLAHRSGRPFELVALATSGDLAAGVPVGQLDVKGMFVDTIREAVRRGDCDLAVHSYKDLPTEPAEGLAVAAVPQREDPRDLLVTRDGYALSALPPAAVVGTSSQRRAMQLLRARPGLLVLPMRGNLDTRLGKVAAGEFDAVVVAYAGLRRLYSPPEAGGRGPMRLPLTAVALEPGECLPAAAQGALAVECRNDDEQTRLACAAVDHAPTAHVVAAERAFLARFGGGCLAAVGALCTVASDGTLELAVMAGEPASRRLVRLVRRGPYEHPVALGEALADDLLRQLAA